MVITPSIGQNRGRKRRISRWTSCRRGGAAIEFALVAPMLIALFAGITVFGLFLGASHNLRLVAAEAARASVAGVSDTERASLARDTVMRSLNNSAMFRPGSVSVQVAVDPGDANVTVVTVTLDATTLGLGVFSKILPQLPNTLTSTVSVRRGGL